MKSISISNDGNGSCMHVKKTEKSATTVTSEPVLMQELLTNTRKETCTEETNVETINCYSIFIFNK
jgi:hypothetical protein